MKNIEELQLPCMIFLDTSITFCWLQFVIKCVNLFLPSNMSTTDQFFSNFEYYIKTSTKNLHWIKFITTKLSCIHKMIF